MMRALVWLRGVVLLAVAAAVVDPGCVQQRPPLVTVTSGASVVASARRAVEESLVDAGWQVGRESGPHALRVALGTPRELVALARRPAGPLVAVRPDQPMPHIEAVAAPARPVVGLVTHVGVDVADVATDTPVAVVIRDGRSSRVLARVPVTTTADGTHARVDVPVVPTTAGSWSLCVALEARDHPPAAADPSCHAIDLRVASAPTRPTRPG